MPGRLPLPAAHAIHGQGGAHERTLGHGQAAATVCGIARHNAAQPRDGCYAACVPWTLSIQRRASSASGPTRAVSHAHARARLQLAAAAVCHGTASARTQRRRVATWCDCGLRSASCEQVRARLGRSGCTHSQLPGSPEDAEVCKRNCHRGWVIQLTESPKFSTEIAQLTAALMHSFGPVERKPTASAGEDVALFFASFPPVSRQIWEPASGPPPSGTRTAL